MALGLLLLATACGRSNLLVGDHVADQNPGSAGEAGMPRSGDFSSPPEPLAGRGSDDESPVTCRGDDAIEVCNGIDDDCDGVIDADCELGDCTPSLVVTDIISSMADCYVDTLPVGSRGELDYPCGGGRVTASFGPITVSGVVRNDFVDLSGGTNFVWDDGCTWDTVQQLTGALSAGTLSYTYSESPVRGTDCARPCTATGTIRVDWE